MKKQGNNFVKSKFSLILKKIISGKNITRNEARKCLIWLLNHDLGIANDTCFGAFFASLQTKSPTPEEIVGLMDAVMKYDRDPIEIKRNFKSPLCGIIGSGKDDLKTFNISSIAAIVAAGAGVKVLKNGSRAEASVTGTTDVFEKLGANVLLKSRKKLQKSIDETNFGFCDAEPYFPRMVREYLGKFYFVHPLSFILPIASGLKFDRVVFGLANENSEITAKLMMLMGYDNSLVVVGHGRSGKILDEISNIGTTKVSEIKNGKIKTYILKPEDLGIKTVSYKYIKEGSSVEENADIFRKIINSKETGPRRDIVLMNAGALIYISGKVSTIKEGIKAAAFSIDNGNAEKVLSRFISIFN